MYEQVFLKNVTLFFLKKDIIFLIDKKTLNLKHFFYTIFAGNVLSFQIFHTILMVFNFFFPIILILLLYIRNSTKFCF